MKRTSVIQMITGKENDLRRTPGFAQAQLYAFLLDKVDSSVVKAVEEYPLFLLDKSPNVRAKYVVNSPRQQTTKPFQKTTEKDFGCWYQKTYEFADNTLLKISGQRRVGVSQVSPIDKGSIVIRARGTAAYRKIKMALVGSPDSNLTEAFIEGRFDILSKAEIMELYRGRLATATLNSCDPAVYNRLFEVLEIQPALVAEGRDVQVAVYDKETGDTKLKVIKKAPRRRLII